ncbi:MAG: permease-like cell division protein FtsX [Proteobacteria bacterium]|jgi:cell division transport system permease protein|nr:permease-like cell division protein FtsX [Pseudomonadota bacterium]
MIQKQLVKGLSDNLSIHVSSFLVLSLSFTVILGSLLINKNLNVGLSQWGSSLDMSVYLSSSVTPEQAQEVRIYLEGRSEVGEVKYISSEQAIETFQEQMATYAPDLFSDKSLSEVIPASFQMVLKKSVSAIEHSQVMAHIAQSLQSMSGVEDITWGQDWVQKYSMISRAIQSFTWTTIAILILGSLFVSANSIRASILRRREEVEILELVGASSTMIRTPYILESMIIAFLAFVASCLLCSGVFSVVQNQLQSSEDLSNLGRALVFASPLDLVLYLVITVGVSALSAWWVIRKINSGYAAASKGQIA